MKKNAATAVCFDLAADEPDHSARVHTCEFAQFSLNGPKVEWVVSSAVLTDSCLTLPLRYSGMPIKRKLIRMMLQLEKVQFQSVQHSLVGALLSHAADYTQSLMSTAIARGELRFRSSEEMVRDYLLLRGIKRTGCHLSPPVYMPTQRSEAKN